MGPSQRPCLQKAPPPRHQGWLRKHRASVSHWRCCPGRIQAAVPDVHFRRRVWSGWLLTTNWDVQQGPRPGWMKEGTKMEQEKRKKTAPGFLAKGKRIHVKWSIWQRVNTQMCAMFQRQSHMICLQFWDSAKLPLSFASSKINSSCRSHRCYFGIY